MVVCGRGLRQGRKGKNKKQQTEVDVRSRNIAARSPHHSSFCFILFTAVAHRKSYLVVAIALAHARTDSKEGGQGWRGSILAGERLFQCAVSHVAGGSIVLSEVTAAAVRIAEHQQPLVLLLQSSSILITERAQRCCHHVLLRTHDSGLLEHGVGSELAAGFVFR